jgi:hypothetical protein
MRRSNWLRIASSKHQAAPKAIERLVLAVLIILLVFLWWKLSS